MNYLFTDSEDNNDGGGRTFLSNAISFGWRAVLFTEITKQET
jgi:hypothetical protein